MLKRLLHPRKSQLIKKKNQPKEHRKMKLSNQKLKQLKLKKLNKRRKKKKLLSHMLPPAATKSANQKASTQLQLVRSSNL